MHPVTTATFGTVMGSRAGRALDAARPEAYGRDSADGRRRSAAVRDHRRCPKPTKKRRTCPRTRKLNTPGRDPTSSTCSRRAPSGDPRPTALQAFGLVSALRGQALSDREVRTQAKADSEALAWMCYEALIGSEFERHHGWHVNLLPLSVLKELPEGWEERSRRMTYGKLTVVVPAASDLLAPKLRRNEPRDRAHAEWARQVGLV